MGRRAKEDIKLQKQLILVVYLQLTVEAEGSHGGKNRHLTVA